MTQDKRKLNGGPRPNSGPKLKPPEEKKVQVYFMIKEKHVDLFRLKVQPIADRLNKK